MRGFSLGLWGDADAAVDQRAIDEIADLGATWIALVVSWAQEDIRASGLALDPSSPPDSRLRAAIRRARAQGLAVMVFPIVRLGVVRRGEWRGTLAPEDIDAWWVSYESFIAHYAAIADEEGAAALIIGSELGSTESWRDRWYHLISRVEKLYRGALVYSANWDHYRQVSFLDRLDHLGISAYFALGDGDDSVASLERAWRRERAALTRFARRRGASLWLTEVGYPSRDGAAARPWDYTGDGEIDVAEQAALFRALSRAWDGDADLGGLFVWSWDGAGGEKDGGYTPRGKPAEAVLRDWFGGR